MSLYKVGGYYFVLDGHHRVSVARYHGVEWIDAHVTEFGAAGVWSDGRDKGALIEPYIRGGEPRMHEMMSLQLVKQSREEVMRQTEQNRLAKALRDSRKLRGSGRVSALAWELKRIAGCLRKLLRTLSKVG